MSVSKSYITCAPLHTRYTNRLSPGNNSGSLYETFLYETFDVKKDNSCTTDEGEWRHKQGDQDTLQGSLNLLYSCLEPLH